MRFHNDEKRSAVIWSSGAEPRQTVSFPSAPAPAAIWPETCTINTTQHNLITIPPLPDGKLKSDGGRKRRPPLHSINSGTFTPVVYKFTFGFCRHRDAEVAFQVELQAPRNNYTAEARPRRCRLQKLEVVAFSNNSIQTSTEGRLYFQLLLF